MTNPKKLRPKVGTHVTGAGFWTGRPKPEILVARLESGESIKCFGLRRIGKSSLIYEIARRLAGHHRPVLQLDGQKIHSIPSFLKEIFAQLPAEKTHVERLLDWTRRAGLPPEVKSKIEALVTEKIVGVSEPAIDAYAELLFKELGHALGALPPGQRPVLCIDELPFFCDNVIKACVATGREAAAARLNSLLAVLRAWRGEDIGVTMAVSGSLSMAWLQREHGVQSDLLNDCIPVQVEELPLEEAVAMVRAMIAYVAPDSWEEGIAGRLCALLPSLFPGVIQFAFSIIRYETNLTIAKFEEIYRGPIAEGLQLNYYNQFDRRIGHFSDAERDAAYKLFNAILSAEGGEVSWPAAEALCGAMGRLLLVQLVEDGFIRASRTEGVRFASGLAFHWFKGGA